MANNRMFLVNDRLGARVYLGKYYPSTGWYVDGVQEFAQSMTKAFDQDTVFGPEGPRDWKIEYEYAD